ncbi:MAG: hypothetical protein IPF77_08805 [Gemmatimonadetes bacterium]|nr:hypothetical protein [Gemmatimonadota bacterium]
MLSPLDTRPPASRQLAELLLGLAGLMHRLRTLPEGHPSLHGQALALERALAVTLAGRERLVMEVGTVQLVVEGMETNPEYEPLRDLAADLRQAGLASLEFRASVTATELLEALTPLAITGVAVAGTRNVGFVGLSAQPTAEDAWLELERLVLGEPGRERAERDPHELALALELEPADPARDVELLGLLSRLVWAAESTASGDPAAAPDGERTRRQEALDLLESLPTALLRRLLAPTGTPAAQAEFLRAVAPILTPTLALRFLELLAHGREGMLSAGALRVLARLALRADESGGTAARRALSEELLRFVAPLETAAPALRVALEPDRVLKLALESGILEPGTLSAADRMIARRQVAALLAILETVPREDPVARAVRARVFHPQTVRVLLDTAPVDLDSIDRLVPGAGLEAAPALLDALAHSRERRVRLRLLDLLARYGNGVGPLASERIDGMPWYVQRNLLALIGRLPDLPSGFMPARLLGHRDPRVRHEAIALAIADPELRTRGLAEALDTNHEPTLRLAFAALADRCPPELLPRLLTRVGDAGLDPELRAMAVTALAPVSDPVVLRLLRRLVVARGLAGLGRLAPKSPPMLAALRGLALHWHSHPKVGALLETARASRDTDIQAAARPGRRSGSGPRVMP